MRYTPALSRCALFLGFLAVFASCTAAIITGSALPLLKVTAATHRPLPAALFGARLDTSRPPLNACLPLHRHPDPIFNPGPGSWRA